jgi:hypothetical protein
MSDPWEVDDTAEAARSAAVNFEAVLISFRKDKNGINLVLAISPHDVPDEIMLAPVGSRYQIAAVMLDDQDKPVRVERSEGERATMRAGMLCQDDDFQEWLVKAGKALSPSEENAKQAIYRECGISSRKELRTNVMAYATFNKMVGLYEEYLLKKGDVS